MGVDNQIRRRFVQGIQRKTAEKIYSEQEKAIVRENLKIGTGKLRNSLTRGVFTVKDLGGNGGRLTMHYVAYTRFLDMKDVRRRRLKYQIYNKIVFGNIYKTMTVKLMYGMTKDIVSDIKRQITGK